MKQYLHILQKEISKVSEADLFVPVKETHIDSLDLVVIRVALEKHFELEIPDVVWFNYQTLAEALEYFHKNKGLLKTNQNTEKTDIVHSEDLEIRMPQMANTALSENWLLKFLGDTHWQLITKGFQKKSSEFKDDDGNRLYSTFIRINYSVSPLCQFSENEIIDFNSSIKCFGNNTFLSRVIGNCDEKKISASLMTTFSVRECTDNNKISKCEPKVRTNKINQLSKTPLFLNDYRLLRKGLIDEISSDYGIFQINDDILFSYEYSINPYYDINGVGLLYFASYPIISDKCFDEYYQKNDNLQTIYRDIFYFANCNSSEKIIFTLNSIEEIENGLKTTVSLYRKSDNQLLSKILTIKQKIE
ncbi:MAG: phosphopantetheine-binding protein [Bacteroidales bacterium]|nr:phosphopantetheine-binding protein [Bacteroidales bacterium]